MLETVIFYLMAAVLMGLALLVVTRTNPVAAALALVAAFGVLAGFYALLNAELVAVLQILVYAGGVMVLVLFVLMLLNLHPDDLKPLKVSGPFASLVLGAVLLGAFLPILASLAGPSNPWTGIVPVTAPEFGGIRSVADRLFSHALLAFEVLSLLLTAAVAGALVLAKRRL